MITLISICNFTKQDSLFQPPDSEIDWNQNIEIYYDFNTRIGYQFARKENLYRETPPATDSNPIPEYGKWQQYTSKSKPRFFNRFKIWFLKYSKILNIDTDPTKISSDPDRDNRINLTNLKTNWALVVPFVVMLITPFYSDYYNSTLQTKNIVNSGWITCQNSQGIYFEQKFQKIREKDGVFHLQEANPPHRQIIVKDGCTVVFDPPSKTKND